ncbi:MAG TPA: FUSC family membrane protein, partial [Verrucomicrobiae bacterium]|nr:FUSC family membrane protein [Verrucomicrobiae bacterium]
MQNKGTTGRQNQFKQEGMNSNVRNIRKFFNSQHFADGLRITLAILAPALIASYFGHLQWGFILALGAMCVALTDAPGPITHRENGMKACIATLFIVVIITLLIQHNVYLLALEVLLFSFFFSMFSIYGSRVGGIGNAAILVMILNMDPVTPDTNIWLHSLLIVGGGLWYMFISIVAYYIRPYRPAQRALGNCISEIAHYLSIKADFYNTSTDLKTNYQKMVNQQVVVNEQLEVVRELFFKTRQILKGETPIAKKLVVTFDETVDLFEDITATYYDYKSLRERFKDVDVLATFSGVLKRVAYELEQIGLAIQSNRTYTKGTNFDEEIRRLKAHIDEIVTHEHPEHTLVLRRIMVNVRRIMQRVRFINSYFDKNKAPSKNELDYSRFVRRQPIDIRLFWDNLNFESLTFKHSIRVAAACIIGFGVAKVLAYGQHTYWILLTIAFIIKPAFGLTRKRNVERILGTLLGAFIGVLILYFIRNTSVQFALLVLFMVGAYSFLRTQYFPMVVFVTAYVVILFKFLGFPFATVVQERVLDTVIGSAIAFTVSYLLFPSWEAHQLKNYMRDMLKANADYLQKLLEGLQRHPISLTDYKVARKEVYIHSANLSAAIQRMLSEPRNKQAHSKEVEYFSILNHLLFSNVATLVSTVIHQTGQVYSAEAVEEAKKALGLLSEAIRKLDSRYTAPR